MVHKTIDEINRYEGTTINPMHSPDEVYELYSVPSFDNDYPEIIAGAHIGSSKVTVRENDVLICKINPRINRVWVVKHRTEHPLLASSEWIVVRNPYMDADYLRWYFSSPTFRVMLNSEVAGIGGSLTRAQPKRVAQYTVPVRSLQEQKNIAAALNRVEELICLRKQQIAKLDELVKSRFIEMFGDCTNIVLLSAVAEVSGGLAKNSKRDSLPLHMPYLRVANVSFATVDVTEMLEIGLTEDEYEKTRLCDGDLLFVEGNGSPDQIGRVAVWHSEISPCVHQNHLIKARFRHNEVLPVYAMHYFMTQQGRMQIKSKAVSTSGLYTLSVTKIESLELPKPSLELQHQFAAFVAQTDQQKLTIQHSLAKLELLKKALMQKYFG